MLLSGYVCTFGSPSRTAALLRAERGVEMLPSLAGDDEVSFCA
jgi:hypothetical protein